MSDGNGPEVAHNADNISHCNMFKKSLSPLVMKNQSQKRLVLNFQYIFVLLGKF